VLDDPPPSFQEAISTPPNAACTDASQPPLISIIIPSNIRTAIHAPSSVSPATPIPSPRSSLAVNPSSPSSESSLEIIDMEPSQFEWEEERQLGIPLEERVKREWLRRKAADLGVTTLGSSMAKAFEPRCLNRVGLDSDEDVPEPHTSCSTPVSMKPSTLTSFPALTATLRSSQRKGTPSPTIPSSPYSFAHLKTALMRSTTSLKSFPVLTEPAVRKPERAARKLFKGKGKEKNPALSAGAKELEDDWELVEVEDAPSPSFELASDSVAQSLELISTSRNTHTCPSEHPASTVAIPSTAKPLKITLLDQRICRTSNPTPYYDSLSSPSVAESPKSFTACHSGPIRQGFPSPPSKSKSKPPNILTEGLLKSPGSNPRASNQAFAVQFPQSPSHACLSFDSNLQIMQESKTPISTNHPNYHVMSSNTLKGVSTSVLTIQRDEDLPSSPTGISPANLLPSFACPLRVGRHYAGRPLPKTPLHSSSPTAPCHSLHFQQEDLTAPEPSYPHSPTDPSITQGAAVWSKLLEGCPSIPPSSPHTDLGVVVTQIANGNDSKDYKIYLLKAV
jgi:hypothetical protein